MTQKGFYLKFYLRNAQIVLSMIGFEVRLPVTSDNKCIGTGEQLRSPGAFRRRSSETSFGPISGTSNAGVFFEEIKMTRFKMGVKNFVSNEDGAALVEYALLVALIAIICILGVTFLGKQVSTKFKGIGDCLT